MEPKVSPKRYRSQWLAKEAIVMLADALLIAFAYGFVLLMRFDFAYSRIPVEYAQGYLPTCIPVNASSMLVMWRFGLYQSIWSYVSVSELVRLMKAWALESVFVALFTFTLAPHMPASYWVGSTALSFALTFASRFSWRLLRLVRRDHQGSGDYRRVMVVGCWQSLGDPHMWQLSSTDTLTSLCT